ncbi:MAG: T9SS type A sorting domain-containing protein [Candidatus Eisenbacteria bacterium]|uniref:T9SS type A sorting domain-containing protein n=1 Tax=Eiseniibacteriota bacterium TaxID=2212470 RepID=A0A7Y2H2T6_UNCEI|nr:T9SS type A sorting domain-containing protein [Candidatus Eisenbacteria bacterium]
MKHRINKLSFFCLLVLGASFAIPQITMANLEPASAYAGGEQNADEITAVEYDASGNFYVAGYFWTEIDLGGPAPLPGRGAFVAKYSPAGSLIWESHIGDAAIIHDIDVKNGWVVAVGQALFSPTNIDGVDYATPGTVLSVRYNAIGGGVNWVNGDTGAGAFTAMATGVEILNNNWALVCGDFEGTADFGGGVASSNGESDFFFQLFNTSGVVQNAVTAGDTLSESGGRLATDSNGDAIFTGEFFGSVPFGTTTLVSNGERDICVVKFANLTTVTWAKSFGGTGADRAGSVDTDGLDNIYVTGSFENTVDFGGGAVSSMGMGDGFVLSLDSAGNYQWGDRFGGTGQDQSHDIDYKDGALAFGGNTGGGSADFGPFDFPVGFAGNAAFFAQTDTSGNWLCAEFASGSGNPSTVLQTSISPSGEAIVGGSLLGGVTFGTIFLNEPPGSSLQAFWVIYSEPVGVADPRLPNLEHFALGLGRPNPFRIQTQFSFDPGENHSIRSAKIFDAAGRIIVDLGTKPDGAGTLVWNGRDKLGRKSQPGIYFLQVSDGTLVQSRRVLLLP